MKVRSRSSFAIMVTGFLLLIACLGVQAQEVDWRQAEGTEIVIGGPTHQYTDALLELAGEFEELTGITVVLDTHSQDAFMNKRLVDLSSGAGVYDVVMIDQAIVQYARAGWISKLQPYLDDPTMFDPEAHDLDEYIPSMLGEGIVDGELYGIPITSTVQMLYYRKDIFEERGLTVPKTFDQLYETALALNEPGKMAGILLRGQKIHTAWGSTGFVWAYGGRIFGDPKNPSRATFDSPEAAAGIQMYAKLLQDAGALGVGNYTWYEAVADFQQGKAAMYIDASTFMAQLEDPEASTVSGKVGYAPPPAGPAGAYANSLAWMLSISSSSRNMVGAALFLSWATSEDVAFRIGQHVGTAGRTSYFSSDWVRENFPVQWAETFTRLAQTQNPESGFPRIVEIDEWLDIYGGAVNATILELGDAESNLKKAADQMRRLLDAM